MRIAGQKYVGRNRPPRVQIEVDVDGAEGQKTIKVPFVMGVMADLSGASASELPDVSERNPIEIDGETFDRVLRAQKPRVQFNIPNAMDDRGGDIPVNITFESLDDFSPAAIARKLEPLRRLLEVREKMENLKLWTDSDSITRKTLEELFEDPAKLNALLSAPPPAGNIPEA